MDTKMFCFQCQETAVCSGCTKFGVCGKSPELANMQDLLIYVTKGLSEVTTRLRKEGKKVILERKNDLCSKADYERFAKEHRLGGILYFI